MDKGKRKKARLRPWFQAAWFALTNGYAAGLIQGKIYRGRSKVVCVPGLNCYSCPGALGACPIGALQSVLGSSGFRISCYVFGFLLLFGTLMGRLVCGWLCPFGWIQDLLYKIPLFHKKKNLPGHKGLRWLRFGILLVFVILLPSLAVGVTGMGEPWFCKYICPSGTLFGGLPLTAVNEGLRAACGFLFQWKVFLLLAVLVLSIKYSRPFCKYICPLGAVYGCFNPISLYRLQVDSQKCIRCGKCQRACGADIPVWEQPNSIDCIRCGDCKAVCPTGAIVSSLDKWKNKRLNTESGIK